MDDTASVLSQISEPDAPIDIPFDQHSGVLTRQRRPVAPKSLGADEELFKVCQIICGATVQKHCVQGAGDLPIRRQRPVPASRNDEELHKVSILGTFCAASW
jgi:hypothetical protein